MKQKNLKLSTKKYLKLEKVFWYLLFISSMIYLLFLIPAYIEGGHKNRSPKWIELIIIPFYFTVQSNFLAFSISFLFIFNFIKNKIKLRNLSILMATNLTITLIVYWAILFPFINIKEKSIFFWLRNITSHALTPIFGIIVFVIKYYFNNEEQYKKRIWTNSFYYLIYPLIWLILTTILYFILGADSEDGVYPFLDPKNKFAEFIIYFFVIAINYYFTTIFYIFLSNPSKKVNLHKKQFI